MVKSFEGPTREQVLRMAREAGADMHCDTLCINGKDADDFLIRFAALAYAAGQEEEREACAELMERQHSWITNTAASVVIRARGNK